MKISNYIFLILGIIVSTSFGYKNARTEPKKKDKPNVLFIAIDDLNDWIGVLGGIPRPKHPIWTDWRNVAFFLAMRTVRLPYAIPVGQVS